MKNFDGLSWSAALRPVFAGMIFTLSLSYSLQAQKPREVRPFEIIPDLDVPSVTTDHGRVHAQTNVPLALYYLNDAAEGNTPTEKALHWLRNHPDQLGLKNADLSDLSVRIAREGKAGTNVRIVQDVAGVPVYGGEIVVNVDPQGRVRYITNGYHPEAELPSTQPGISAEMARSATLDWMGLEGPLQLDKSRLVVWANQGQSSLAWEIRMIGESPIGDWEAIVDAQSGVFLALWDVSCYHHGNSEGTDEANDADTPEMAEYPSCDAFLPPSPVATGSGFVFDPDPLSSATTAYAGQFVDGGDATNASLDGQRQTRTLQGITLSGGVHSLVGPFASILEFEAPARGTFAQASSTFNFNRFDNAFEGVNTYYQIDQSMRYLNNTLGVIVMPYQYTGGVRFDPHGLNGADNSHYLGGNGRIAFGEGGVDDAEDADVIIHELGHGLHDWITVGGLSNNQGLSEGTGDYWAQSYSRSLNQWTSGQAAYHFVFSWDGHNPFWGGRTTNYGATYPGGLTGAIHTDGQIWSTCLMKIYDAIGRTPTDIAVWEGLAMTGGGTNQQDAAIAVRQAAINMGYPSGQIATISTLLTSCGYTLPVILDASMASLEAVRISPAAVKLDWNFLTTGDIATCIVERRLDSENEFVAVGQAELNKLLISPGHYAFTDPNGYSGTSWYRILFVSENGEEARSEAVAVAGFSSDQFRVSLWPNPSKSTLNLEVNLPGAVLSPIEVTVTDLTGKICAKEVFTAAGAASVIRPAFAKQLNAGVYLVHVRTEQGAEVLRWVKQ